MIRLLAAFAFLGATSVACAHFPWLYVTDEAYPRLFFGESLQSKDYHLPESVAAAEVMQSGIDAPAKPLKMEPHEADGFIGLEGEEVIEPRGCVRTSLVYGSYHGSKLTYYAQHFPADNPQAWPDDNANDSPMRATLQRKGEQLLATITWQGKPLAGIDATLMNESDEKGASSQTDEAGVAAFDIGEVVEGLNGIMVMHVDKDDAGEVAGKTYTSATHILTATFNYDPSSSARVSALPALPEAVASFGGAVSDGWLYVYGGHIGQAHDHSRENLSAHFRRIKLDGSGSWEELPMGQPLQGLPLVTHGGKLYRLGGLDARNASGEEEQLHSVDTFASYDPQTKAWTELPSLPAARSSHNAVVLGDTLYAVGGWRLHGDYQGEWQAGALSFDLSDANAKWQQLPEAPFKRRALAVSHVNDRLVVLCGMTDDADLSKQVFFYDPNEKAWSEGPEFPGKAFHGFGLAAWNLNGKLYAGGMEGVLYQLSDDRSEWTKAGEFTTKRFFHQLLPDGNGALLAVAGASPKEGHTGSIERIIPGQPDHEIEAEAEPVNEPVEATGVEASEPTVSCEPSACPGDRWPMFRGNGSNVTTAKNLPLQWSDEEGIAWRADLPGYGQSSPVVWGDRVFVTTMQGDEKESPTILAIDLTSGQELWRREFTSSQQVTASNYVSRSAPTPCVDQDYVYAFFESGDLIALDHAGNELWQRSLVSDYGKIEGNHGLGGSPAMMTNSIVVPVLHGGPSYLVAVDKLAGTTLWKTDFEARVAWSSPTVVGETIVLSANGTVEAFEGSSGKSVWSLEGLEGNNVPSPSLAGELLLIGSKDRTSNLAIRLKSNAGEILWRSNRVTSSFASPLVHRGLAYFVSKAGVAHCVDATTGKLAWKERLPSSCWATPLAASEHVYFFSKDGETVVYEANGKAAVVASNQLKLASDSRLYCFAAVDSRLLIRTGASLICISQPNTESPR